MNLTELTEGRSGSILHIHMDAKAKQRLCHVGIYEGALLYMERKGRKGHPCTILVCGNFMMLRYEDALCIEVEEQ